MAITGLGMDAVELSRIEKIVAEPKTFLQKVLTPAELEKYNSLPTKRKVEFLAGRFAAKEAYAKALGTGIGQHVSFQDIEVLMMRLETSPCVQTVRPQNMGHHYAYESDAYAVVVLESNE